MKNQYSRKYHFATVTINIVGRVYRKFPVVSNIITASETVILEEPANIAVAPSHAQVPSSTVFEAKLGYSPGF